MPTLDPNSNILVDTEWLADNLDDPQLRIVDCDEPLAYDRMHITGAIKIPVFHYIKNTSVVSPAGYGVNVMTAEEVSALLHKMGIGPNDKVVAYDNSLSLYAARFWWVLRYYGFQFVKIVDGVPVRSPKTHMLFLGICVILVIIVAEVMIVYQNPAEIFRGINICPLH